MSAEKEPFNPDEKAPISKEEMQIDPEKDTIDLILSPSEILKIGRVAINHLKKRLKMPGVSEEEKDSIEQRIEEIEEETKKAMAGNGDKEKKE